ncbi:MAG TPA: MFS transporter [Anaerolineales bacterium]|nr:MFS transporter [Anaerolineales bacterium]
MSGIAYAIITLATSTLWGVISGWLLYFYLPPTGTPLVPVALYSLVMLISRIVNIVITLPIGYLSDRTHTRWGRRMPYVVGGALFVPFLFVLLWKPPHMGESMTNLIYIAVLMVVFNVVYEIHQIPYEAMLPDLFTEDKQRINVSAWRSAFQFLGAIVVGAAGPLIEKTGYANTVLIFAVGSAPFLFLPMFFLREKNTPPRDTTAQTSLMESIRLTLSNKAFQIFTLAWALSWIASTFMMETLPYIVTEVCRLNEADTIYFYLPAVIVSLLCFPLVTWLAKRFGKLRIFSGSLLLCAIIQPGLMLIGDWIPIPLMAQGIAWVLMVATALSAARILPTAIAADITDLDEKITGLRREGSFYAFWGLLDQLASGVGSACLPLFLLLGRSKTDPQGPLGIRLLGLGGGVLLFLGFLIFRKYPHPDS